MDTRGILILAGGLFVASCNKSALPLPPMGPNETPTPIVVPFPPPPARAEIVSPKPGEQVVWIDGSWQWDRRRWVWQRGRWEVPQTGAHYALPKIEQLPDGTLGWYPGGWQRRNQQSTQAQRINE